MRRVLTILMPAALLLASLCIGVFTADLPFWRRAIDLPLEANEAYVPTVRIGDGRYDVAIPVGTSLDRSRLEAVVDRAREAGVDALLVMRGGELELERYFSADKDNFSLHPAGFLARPLAALAVGFAWSEGRIDSLDVPVSRWLPEWEGEARGAITLRQLLNETSGLDTGADAADVLDSRPFERLARLPAFATSRGVRLYLGNDFERTALGFRLEHEPGGFFNVSPVNTQLAAIIVERVTGMEYERWLETRLLSRPGFAAFELQLDRRSGMPAAHCCLRATPRDVLRVAEFVRTAGEGAFPDEWLAQILKGSRAHPEFGLQVEKLTDLPVEVWQLGSQTGGGAWIVPAARMSIVVLARRDVPTPVDLVAPLLESFAGYGVGDAGRK
jgi:CubicO group peptidase (beta-lactamase class C family)